jgi:enoyl-[acyl-carrier protein] reductase I
MGFTVSEVAEAVKQDLQTIDILVHSLANGPEVAKPLLETSRKVFRPSRLLQGCALVAVLVYQGWTCAPIKGFVHPGLLLGA